MIQIYLKSIHSHEETNEVGADEPYVLVTAVNLASRVNVQGVPVPVPAFDIVRYGFTDVDDEETHGAPGPSKSFWGLNGLPAPLADPDSAIFIVSLMENDDGDPEALRGVVKGVVGGSIFGSLSASRADKVTTLINDINSAMGTPTGGPNFDDKIGLQELRFTADELGRAEIGEAVRKSIHINGDGGRYELTFEAWNVNPFPNWQLLDLNAATAAIVADGSNLYQRHANGAIFKFTGTPMTGWQLLDNNGASKEVVASGGNLYQRHANGAIFKFTGTPMTGWQLLDLNAATAAIVADGSNLYQRHANGAIFKFTGTPMTGWQLLDNNGASKEVVASGGNLYQRHANGAIFKFTGTPMTGWQLLDLNAATAAIVAGGNNLYQRHNNGAIFKSTA